MCVVAEIAKTVMTVVVVVVVTGDHDKLRPGMNLVQCVKTEDVMTVREVLKALKLGDLVVELGVTRKRKN